MNEHNISACDYCVGKKSCIKSVGFHDFIGECFIPENSRAKHPIGLLNDIYSENPELRKELERIAMYIVDLSNDCDGYFISNKKLETRLSLVSKTLAAENCERICVNAVRPPCTEIEDCSKCEHKCPCVTCENYSNLEIDFDKLRKEQNCSF